MLEDQALANLECKDHTESPGLDVDTTLSTHLIVNGIDILQIWTDYKKESKAFVCGGRAAFKSDLQQILQVSLFFFLLLPFLLTQCSLH